MLRPLGRSQRIKRLKARFCDETVPMRSFYRMLVSEEVVCEDC